MKNLKRTRLKYLKNVHSAIQNQSKGKWIIENPKKRNSKEKHKTRRKRTLMTKRNQTKQNEISRNESKENETWQNVTKRHKTNQNSAKTERKNTKRNKTKRVETERKTKQNKILQTSYFLWTLLTNSRCSECTSSILRSTPLRFSSGDFSEIWKPTFLTWSTSFRRFTKSSL